MFTDEKVMDVFDAYAAKRKVPDTIDSADVRFILYELYHSVKRNVPESEVECLLEAVGVVWEKPINWDDKGSQITVPYETDKKHPISRDQFVEAVGILRERIK